MAKSGATWTFSYDANGMRTRRTSGAVTYNYTYSGSQLTHMTVGGYTLHFYYDANGYPMSVVYNGTTYYYATNLQGDVVAILNSSGVQVVGYRYDAWGRLLTTTGSMSGSLGYHNPLRYRGYVYDHETQLYYLQSRYYNPAMGRFINADAYASTGQGILNGNMFAYCNNNPVTFCDPSGHGPITALILTALLCGIISAGSDMVGQMIFDQKSFGEIDWGSVAISGTAGMCAGLIPGSGFLSLAGQAVVSAFVDNGLRAVLKDEEFEIAYVVQDSVVALGTGYIMKGISHFTEKITSKIFNKAPNYSQYQHYFRNRGHNYTRQEVCAKMQKHIRYENFANELVGSVLDFVFSVLVYP